MTLILALACSDAVVVAADSQATFTGGGQPLRATEDKLWQVKDAPVVAGVSGHVGTAQKIRQSLAKIHDNVLRGPITAARPILRDHVCKALNDTKDHFIQAHPSGGDLITNTVICGYTVDSPWILEITCNGLDEQHEHRGFMALGSGESFAHFACASMQHHAVRELGAKAAQVLAYRTIDTAIEVAAYGLGGPVQMWLIDANGARAVTEADLQVIGHTANLWKATEAEFLQGAVLEAPDEPALDTAPAPQDPN
jgi:20S proteasome alpha/beta subunit